MKMKTMLMGLILAGGIAAQASAQSFRLGLEGGANIANFSGDFGGATGLGSRVGVVGGAFLQLNFSDSFAIQPEILYTQKGGTQAMSGGTVTIDVSYLEFPVLIKFYLPTPGIKPNLFVGGSASLLAAASNSANGNSSDISSFVNSSDVGLIGGAGVDIDKFSLSARYELGLGDVSKSTATNYTNGIITFLVGYSFI